MKITNKELVSTQETINVTVEFNEVEHRFQAVVYESPKYKFVTKIWYLDKYEKKLKNSEKRKVKEFVKNQLLNEGKADIDSFIDSFRDALQSAIQEAKQNMDKIGNVDEFLNDVK